MIPKLLKIKGLYAYRESQEVDFETLISGGLFGIFGAVGSGKSSILEAIMFVLYGETGRLKKSEKPLYNMMNLQSQELLIDFSFYAGKNHQQVYRAFYRAQRNKKDFTKVEPKDRAYYIWEADTWLPLPDKDATDIIGMSYHHFKQTIIIPQGKFRDFVELRASDRSGMMKELFQLEQFDLYDKTSRLYKKSDAELHHISGQLTAFEGLDESGIEALEATLRQHKTDLDALKKQCEASTKALQKLNALATLHQEYVGLKAEKESHSAKIDAIKAREVSLQQYQKVNRYFKNDLEHWQEYQHEIRELNVQILANNNTLQALKPDLEKAINAYTFAKEEYLKKDARLQLIADLENLYKLLKINTTLSNTSKNLAKQKSVASAQSERLKAIVKEKDSHKQQLIALEASLPDLVSLSLQEARWQQAEMEKEKIALLAKQIEEYHKVLDAGNKQLSDISNTYQPFEDFTILKKDMATQLSQTEQALLHMREEKEKLAVKAALHHYASHLHDNEPCPLCGALEHPALLQEEHAEESLLKQQNKLLELEAAAQQLRQKITKTDQLLLSQKHLKEKLEDANTTLASLHKNWENIDKLPDIRQIREDIARGKKMQQQIVTLKQLINEQENSLLADTEKLELANSAQQTLTLQYEKQEGIRQNIIETIKTKTLLDKLEEKSAASILERIEKGKAYVQTLEANFNKAETTINTLKTSQTNALANQESLQANLDKSQAREQAMRSKLSTSLATHDFSSIEAVSEIMQQSIDENKEEAFIRNFYDKLNIIEDRLKTLLQDETLQSFSLQQHNEAKEAEQKAMANQRDCEKNIAIVEKEVQSMTSRLKAMKTLHKQKEALEKRMEDLKKLLNLFKGNGFVNYISSIFLEELCHTANRRFTRLSQNNLSMALDEINNFIVADHLNGGKKRLLKTLSGGQIFQAALCLALALAEKIKSLNQADQSFFFLDEGFGALDSTSLRVVFETLKSLKQENRIVGIISHVESLQQEIDIYAQIILEKEKGSQVQYSWHI